MDYTSNIKTPMQLGEIAAKLGRSAFENPYFYMKGDDMDTMNVRFDAWAKGWHDTNMARIEENKTKPFSHWHTN